MCYDARMEDCKKADPAMHGAAHFQYGEGRASGECVIVSDGPVAPNDADIRYVGVALNRRADEGVSDLEFPVGQMTVKLIVRTGEPGIGQLRAAYAALRAITSQHGPAVAPKRELLG